MAIPHDIVESRRMSTRKKYHQRRGPYLSTSRPFRWFATISNKNGIVVPSLVVLVSTHDVDKRKRYLRTTRLVPRDKRLDNRHLLGGDIQLIRLHHVIKHHLARMFVLPFLVWSIAERTSEEARVPARRQERGDVQRRGDKDAVPDVGPRTVSEVMTQPCQLDTLDVLVRDTERAVHVPQVGCHESGEVAHAFVPLRVSAGRVAKKRLEKRTETVLEPVMRGPGKNIVRETELFDVSQALKMFSRFGSAPCTTRASSIRTYR